MISYFVPTVFVTRKGGTEAKNFSSEILCIPLPYLYTFLRFDPLTSDHDLFSMPKIKSHSGAKKRLRKTGSGKYALKRRGRNHLLLQKSKRQKHLNRTMIVSNTEYKSLQSLVPYL